VQNSFSKSRLRFALFQATLFPVYCTAGLFHRLLGDPRDSRTHAWEERLHYRWFLQGLPALLTAAAVAALATFELRSRADTEGRFASAAATAGRNGDYETAALCYDRLMELQPGAVEFRFQRGIVAAELGDEARAAALIGPLAPRDATGYAPAHLWLVERVIAAKRPLESREWEAAESHLLRLRRQAPELAAAADKALAKLYVGRGQADAVLGDSRLHATVRRDPALHLALAHVLAAQGRRSEAEAVGREVLGYFRGRVDDDPDDRQALLNMADAHALVGEHRSALFALQRGVMLHPGGPFEARLVDATVLEAVRLQGSSVTPADEKKAACRRAKELISRYGGDSVKSRLQLGQMSRLLGEAAEAERHYLSAVESVPDVRMELADLFDSLGQTSEALEQYELFEAECRALLKRGAELTSDRRRLVAAAAGRRGDYAAAAQWLRDAPPNDEIRTALAQTYLDWWDSLGVLKPDSTGPTRIDLLREALGVTPWNTPALARLLQTARLEGTRGAEARTTLQGMIAAGEMPAVAYLLLGSDAFERGEPETAARYLAQAHRLDPHSSVVLNNLAWTLLHADPPDVEQAERLAGAAVQLSPNDPHFRDTRFRILARQGRYKEALVDLEYCTKAFAGDPEFHRLAAETYDRLQLPDLAAEHRRRAKQP
jgi:tetratricopeptide (TPR) repeat protein